MKIFANIPGAIKMLKCLKYLQPYKVGIEEAKAAGDTEKEREYILKATSTWGPMVLKMIGTELTVEGMEKLPEKGPVVFIGNHQGYSDIFAYCAAFRKFQLGFVAKTMLSKIPFYGKWIRRTRSVFIKRDDARASLEAINEGIEYIKQGFSMVIFPEGTRSQGPEPGHFQRGSLKLATKPGVPIVPVSIHGSWRMFEETGCLKPTKISIMVHEPLETAGISRKEEKELAGKVEKIVVDGVRELQAREAEETK